MKTDVQTVAVMGAGPAGLSAAHELTRRGIRATVYEGDGSVGGLSRTVSYKGFRFDVGGHRFYTRIREVEEFWRGLLGPDLLTRPRLSRILYDGRWFDYPLNAANALAGLGPAEALRVAWSYGRAVLFPSAAEETFEQWVVGRFGRRLYEIFFKTYTEKVWGMPCSEISADWARQRIRNLDLGEALKNALLGAGSGAQRGAVPSLVDQFLYPRLGPGMMWDACRRQVEQQGGQVLTNRRVTALRHDRARVADIEVTSPDGRAERVAADAFISTLPMRDLVLMADPPAPPRVREAAQRLRYRDFLTVVLIVDEPDLFPDNWIYVHSADVKVGRVQNYRNWSPDMVPDAARTALGLEYFATRDDELWRMDDAALTELGRRECERLGLVRPGSVSDATVVRAPNAYPVYDRFYAEAVNEIRRWAETLGNLQLAGRNGQHRYNNQDHSILTGMLAARRLAGVAADPWNIAAAVRDDKAGAPGRPGEITEEVLREVFARYDPVALGGAVGFLGAAIVFAASVVPLLTGTGEPVPMLSLLGNYLLGYRVSWTGALAGAAEAGVAGFIFGYALAGTINGLVRWHEIMFRRRVEAARMLV